MGGGGEGQVRHPLRLLSNHSQLPANVPPRMSGAFATVLAMRFLHTSDWHLGRSLHRADLREAQAAFLDHLVETTRSERVDAVLVAGDVYDRAIPPVDAVALYEDALARLRATGARVILISGNHDSARRLGVNSSLIDASGVHLRTRPAALAEPVLLADEHGEVAVYGDSLPGARPVSPPGRSHPGRERHDRAVTLSSEWRTWPYPGGRRRPRHRPHRRPSARLGGERAGRAGACGRRAAAGERVRAGHLRRRHRLRPAACSTASATSRSATCTAGRSWRTTCGTPARRCRTRSPRRTTEGQLACRGRRRSGRHGRHAGAEWVPAPCLPAARRAARAASTTC